MRHNTELHNINRITRPCTATMIDRYAIAANWCYGLNVLDYGCGTGYGSGILLALGAKSVTGLDIDAESLKQAECRYQSPFLRFVEHNLLEEKFQEQFDIVIMMEMIEHIERNKASILFERLSNMSHQLLLSTPRRKEETWTYKGGSHFHEYRSHELIQELKPYYDFIHIGTLFELVAPYKQWATDLSIDNTENGHGYLVEAKKL